MFCGCCGNAIGILRSHDLCAGLGKTLQTLGLILSNPPEGHSYPCKNRQVRNRNAAPRCTLIVCPLSVMATWMVEITKHVNQGKKNKNLTAMIYHGA